MKEKVENKISCTMLYEALRVVVKKVFFNTIFFFQLAPSILYINYLLTRVMLQRSIVQTLEMIV